MQSSHLSSKKSSVLLGRALAILGLALTSVLPVEPLISLELSTPIAHAQQLFVEGKPFPLQPDADLEPDEIFGQSLAYGRLAINKEQRFKINGVDRQQIEGYLALAKRIEADPELGKKFTAGEPIDLPEDLAAAIELDRLSVYDRRLIRSILHSITPSPLGGAGQEYVDVDKITKQQRTEGRREDTETFPPPDEDQKESSHFKDFGSATDVDEIDYLRGTKFTIVPEVNDFGEQTNERVEEYEHLPLQPIKVSYQVAGSSSGLPNRQGDIRGLDPQRAGQKVAASRLLDALLSGAERAGFDFDFSDIQKYLENFTNLAQAARMLGVGALPQALEVSDLAPGKHSLRRTGQQAIEDATDGALPSFGIYGNDLDEFFRNTGREVITKNLNLAHGGLIGAKSQEILTNAGERYFESALGDLPLGSLDGIQSGNRADLEARVGRGALAQEFDLEAGDVVLTNNSNDFINSLGLVWDEIQRSPQRTANLLQVADTDPVAAINSNPTDWLRQVGRARLKLIEDYLPDRRDAALDLEEHPTIINLPSGTDQSIAQELLDSYQFKDSDRTILEQIVDGQSLRQVFTTDEDLRAWLAVTAFTKDTNPNESRANRFLAADTSVFTEVGIDRVAKAIYIDNNQRAGLRQYLHRGVIDEKYQGLVSINDAASRAGFFSKVDFDAVFRHNAPDLAFENIGRREVILTFSGDEDLIQQFLTSPVISTTETKERLERLRNLLTDLSSRPQVAEEINKGLGAVNSLLSDLEAGRINFLPEYNQFPTDNLAVLYQTGQALSNDPEVRAASQYRDYSLTLSQLTSVSTEAAYGLSNDQVRLPTGTYANEQLTRAFNNEITITEMVERVGGEIYDAAFNLEPDTTYPVYKNFEQLVAIGNIDQAKNLINNFIQENLASFREIAGVIKGQFNAPFGALADVTPQSVAMLAFQGTELEFSLGSIVIDEGLELAAETPFRQIVNQFKFNGEAGQIIQQSQALRKISQVLAGIPNIDLDPSEIGNEFGAVTLRWAANRVGLEYHPDFDEMIERNGGVFNVMETLSGQSIGSFIRDNGILGLTDAEAKAYLKGDFWQNGRVLDHLEQIANGSFPSEYNLPAGALRHIFDPNISAADKEQFFKDSFRQDIIPRLTNDYIDSSYGLGGQIASQAITGAANILLSDGTAQEKSAAMKDLGLSIADTVSVQTLGLQVSVFADDKIATKEKLKYGLNSLSQSFGLDPTISTLANFFIDGGVDTSTAEGRSRLTNLVVQVGSRAGVPAEYLGIAAGFINGNIEGTLVAFAGSKIDGQLQSLGVPFGFGQFYDAFIRPSDSVIAQAQANVLAGFGVNSPLEIPAGGGVYDALVAEQVSKIQAQKQQQIYFGLIDAGIGKVAGTAVPGFTNTMLTGSFEQQVTSVGQVIAGISGNENAATILGGVQVALDLKNFFGGNEKDLTKVSGAAFSQLDGYLSNALGAPVPTGTGQALLAAIKTGSLSQDVLGPDGQVVAQSFDSLLQSDFTKVQLSGYLDQAVGLPAGSTFAVYSAFQSYQAASDALAIAQVENLISGPNTGLIEGLTPSGNLAAAQQQLGVATANLVSLGVNLVFGSQLSQLDQNLGLPQGTTSMLVNGLIASALIPGFGLAAFATNMLLPFLGQHLLGGILNSLGLGSLGGIFGFGGGKRVEIIWSYRTDLWPEEVPYDFSDEENPKADVNIVFQKELPFGVFKGNSKEEFQAGSRAAANNKIEGFLGNLLQMDEDLQDRQMLPNQIRTHQQKHFEVFKDLIDTKYGTGEENSYSILVTDEGQRRGIGWDEANVPPIFTDHIHYQY